MKESSSQPYLTIPVKEALSFSLPSDTGRTPFDLSKHLSGPGIGPSTNISELTDRYLTHDGYKVSRDGSRRIVHLPAPTGPDQGIIPPLKNDKKAYSRYRGRILRSVEKLASRGLVDLQKGNDSLIWVAPNNRTFNLIREKYFSNFKENKPDSENKPIQEISRDHAREDPGDPISRPRAHIRPERYRALQVSRRTRTLEEEDLSEIHNEYLDYRREIDSTVLLFKRREDLRNIDGEVKTLPYTTRFNSTPRKIEAEKKYKAVWNNAGVMFNKGVFLTLTTDPKRHRNVEEANKAFGPAINRFMTYIRKRVKELGYGKLSYITANEFQKNGLLHAHIVIFGIPYLEHYKRISYLWSRTGQGNIIYVYGLNKDGKGWYWRRGKPRDAEKGQSCHDYLKKYLSKNLQDDGQDLYWTFGKRYYTNSATLEPDLSRPVTYSPGQWVYIGSCNREEVPHEVETYNRKIRSPGPPGPPLPVFA